MRKRVLVLLATVTLSLVALFSLMWLASSPPLVAHADPAKSVSETSTNTAPHHTTNQATAQGCAAITSDILISDTWTAPCYRIMTSTVTIHPGVILTISPPTTGTRVEFLAGAQLQTWGTLYALGTASQPITFTSVNTTSPGRCDWLGIILEGNSGGDLIQRSVVEYACTGFKINDEDNVSILSNVFRRNDAAIVGTTDGSFIANNSIYSCTDGIVLKKSYSNQMVGNTIYDVDNDGLAFIIEGAPGGDYNRIFDNEIYNCGNDGLRVEDGDQNEISNNEIYNCGRNGTRLDDGYRNIISRNLVFLNDYEGIYLSAQERASVQYNHVYSNGGGSSYRAAIYVTGANDAANNYPDISRNVIYDRHGEAIEYAASNNSPSPSMALNALCSIHSFELRNDDSATINAPSNWWSTNTPTDSVSGLVEFIPWINLSLHGTADGAVTVTLRDRDGNTVPPPPVLQTTPPAPDARRIELSTNWGILSSATVFVDGDGITTTTLIPGESPGPETIVLTATDFCGYYVTDTVELPNLGITKTTAIPQAALGGLVTYTIAYSNAGESLAEDAVISDTLPDYTTYVTDTSGLPCPSCFDGSPGPLTWSVGAIAPGAPPSAFTMTLRAGSTAPCGQRLTNTVSITTTTLEVTTGNDLAHSPPVTVVGADVAISKTTELTEVVVGTLLTYTIAYSNIGQAGAGNVVISDTLPPWTTYLTDTSGLPCLACRLGATGPLTWTVGHLAAGAVDRFELILRVSAMSSVISESLTNTVSIATISPECDLENNLAHALAHAIGRVDLVVVKDDDVGPTTALDTSLQANKQAAVTRLLQTARAHAPLAWTQHREFVYEGDLVTFTIAVVNVGPFAATNVVLTETLPEHTDYVGFGWIPISDTTYITTVGTLPPGDGRIVYFVVRVHDPLPAGVNNLVNLVCGASDQSDTNPGDNCNYEDTPVRTDVKLYVASRRSGTVDVFNTTDFGYLTTIPASVNPYGMATDGNLLFVADFDEPASTGSLHVVETVSDTMIASVTGAGAHPVHVAAYDGHVYVASHSGPPPITVVSADPPWNIVAEMYLDRDLIYEFGFFGATADEERGCIYLTKPDFGGVGIWRLTPTSTTWQLDYVYPTDEAPRSILYHPTTDRVYAAFGGIDELWIFDPEDWELLDRISTGHQDSTYPGYGGHGLAALGQCVFVSNYKGKSVTAIIGGSCVGREGAGPAIPPTWPHRIYLPIVGKNLTSGQRIVTIPLSGRPEGMTGRGNLLFVALSSEDKVAVINTETLTVIGEISTQGDHPHVVILAGGN